MKRNKIIKILLGIIFLIGLAVLCFPMVSNWFNLRYQEEQIVEYEEAMSSMTRGEKKQSLADAEEYNEKLKEIGSASALADPEQLNGYADLLNSRDTGMMGYIEIDSLDISLPIYHGTSSGVLQIAAGHLEGSSLPVGGEGTHCVLAAHSGLPSAKLFTDISKMEIGDTFTLHVFGRTLTYEVDQITIVLPDETENIYIEDGKDYCTLMTCTPYGINTHRLLVRGERVDSDKDVGLSDIIEEMNNRNYTFVVMVGVIVLVGAFLASFITGRVVKYVKKKNNS